MDRGRGDLKRVIAVAVDPPLPGDVLARAPRAANCAAVLVQPDGALTVWHYDLAVVSGG